METVHSDTVNELLGEMSPEMMRRTKAANAAYRRAKQFREWMKTNAAARFFADTYI